MLILIYIFVKGLVYFSGDILVEKHYLVKPKNHVIFDIFRTEVWNVKLYTYLELASYDLQNGMHINEFCKISNFLIRYKFKIKFLALKILGKICGKKIFYFFF